MASVSIGSLSALAMVLVIVCSWTCKYIYLYKLIKHIPMTVTNKNLYAVTNQL